MTNEVFPARQHRDVGHGFKFYDREFIDLSTNKPFFVETFVPIYGRCPNCPENGRLVAAPTTHAGPSMTSKRPRAGANTSTGRGCANAGEGQMDRADAEIEELDEDAYEEAVENERVMRMQMLLHHWVLDREAGRFGHVGGRF